MVVEHQSIPLPWLGLGRGGRAAGLLITGGAHPAHRSRRWDGAQTYFPSRLLGNEPGHWGSRLPWLSPRQPRGHLGLRWPRGHGATSKAPGTGLLVSPPPPPARGTRAWGSGFAPVASCGSPRGGGGHILSPAPWVEGCTGSPRGSLCRGLCRDLPVPPKTPPPPQESSPLSQGHPVPMELAGGGAATKSLQQQWGHSTSSGSVGC